MKCCSVCGAEKSKEDFNWRNKSKGWLRPECRLCQRNAYLKAKAKDPVAFNAAALAKKRKWKIANPEAGKRWYAEHREQEQARGKEKRSRLGEQMNARRRERYRLDPVFRAKLQAATDAWELRNRERIREYLRQYCQTHKAQFAEKRRRRRALQLSRTVQPFTLEQLDQRMSVFGHCCAYCGGPFEHVDHVIALARGGLHCLANLRPACAACNLRKWAKPISKWLSEVA